MQDKAMANKKPFLTANDLIESLLIISETTKTLALEVMLLPAEQNKDGGEEDVNISNKAQ